VTDVFTKEKRSEIMSRIRSRDTKPERDFQKRHPKAIPHPDWLPYHPDFILDGEVVFLDSTFWHGRIPKRTYERLSRYWQDKLFRNIVRDAVATSFYEAIGILKRITVSLRGKKSFRKKVRKRGDRDMRQEDSLSLSLHV